MPRLPSGLVLLLIAASSAAESAASAVDPIGRRCIGVPGCVRMPDPFNDGVESAGRAVYACGHNASNWQHTSGPYKPLTFNISKLCDRNYPYCHFRLNRTAYMKNQAEYYSQQYNARAAIPEPPYIFTRWLNESAQVRRSHAALL